MNTLKVQITFIHGLAASKNFFNEIEKSLRVFGAETLSFDLLGFGENKNKGEIFTLEEHLSHISVEISRKFPRDKVILAGHSMGGILALAFARENQDRVEKIILLNTPLFENRKEAESVILKSRTGWGYYLLSAPNFSRHACNILCQHNLMRFFKFLKPPYIPNAVFTDYHLHTFKSLNETFRNIVIETSAWPILREISLPILNLIGDRDSLSNHNIRESNVITKVLSGGHYAPLQNIEETAEEIRKFISTL